MDILGKNLQSFGWNGLQQAGSALQRRIFFLTAGAVMANGKEHDCEGTKNKLYKNETCKGDELEYSYDFCMFLFHCDLILWEVQACLGNALLQGGPPTIVISRGP